MLLEPRLGDVALGLEGSANGHRRHLGPLWFFEGRSPRSEDRGDQFRLGRDTALRTNDFVDRIPQRRDRREPAPTFPRLSNDLSNTLTGDVQLRCQIALARPSGRGGVIKNLPAQEILKNLLLGDPIGTTPDDRDLFRDEIDAGDGIRGFFLRGFFNGLDCLGCVDLGIGQTVSQLFDEFPKFAPGFVANSGQPVDLRGEES